MDAQSMAAHRPEYHARYAGLVTSMPEQLRVMMGRRLSNGCLAAREECNRFVEERTR
jgi:hypothetical protein